MNPEKSPLIPQLTEKPSRRISSPYLPVFHVCFRLPPLSAVSLQIMLLAHISEFR
jgi:hypothetical protein